MLYSSIIITGLVCALIALFAWNNRAERGAIAFMVLMLGVMIWSLGYAQELHSTDLPTKIPWAKAEYIGIVIVPVAWLAFALQYTEHDRWATHRRLALLAIPSLLTLALVWTNEAHGLIWSSISLVPGRLFMGWQATYGAGFWLFMAYAYTLLLIGTLLLLRVAIQRPSLYRGQAGALLAGSLIPWLGNLIDNIGLSPLPGLELAPFAFMITGLTFTWALTRWRLFDIVPVARDRVIERMRDGVIVLDAQDRVVDINPAACRIIEWERASAIGRPILPILGQQTSAIERLIDANEADEQIAINLAGQQRVFQVRISPLSERRGALGGRLVILSDITKLKQAEQDLIEARMVAEAANDAKGTFLATMSHEIRTPMNGVLGMADLLLESDLSGPQQELAQMIYTSGNQLMRMINTILDFSKIEAGQLELDAQPFALRTCVESSLDIVAAAAAEKGLELSYQIAPGTPTMIVQDQTRLRQILANLLNNAVKFTQRGEVELRVGREGIREGVAFADTLAFAVRDTGIGIPSDRIGRLFRSFSQVDTATARTYGGTGLGLAISKLLVEAMGGAMSVESAAGEGSTFSFSIMAPPAQGVAPSAYEAATPELQGRRALIVDDSKMIRLSLAAQLDAWGMRPTAVESGPAAIKLLREGASFDLAIIEAQMAEMSGMDLAGVIRQIRPVSPLPIILLGALGATPPVTSDPTTAQLSKPIKFTRLHACMARMLSAQTQPEPVVDQPERPAANKADQRASLRILMAEDNLINQQLITKMLGRMSYKADIVTNGREAIEAMRQKDYDLVLMDVQMPEMDGLEATRAIRAMRVGARQPWIIAVTAGSVEGDREACFAAGMNDFIAKPVEQQILARALARCQGADSPQEQASVAAEEQPQTVAARPAPPSLDRAVLQELSSTLGDQGDSLLASLIRTFIEGANSLQASAREALGRGDSPTLRRAMHTLKSNASTFGAQPLAALCRELEQRSAAGDLEDVGAALDAVATEFARVREALEAL
ncbi:response regulator [Chloroflexales bacterium ZM16-3]|nr:response regulator [Chloroflexales bacterium ZM16-3]